MSSKVNDNFNRIKKNSKDKENPRAQQVPGVEVKIKIREIDFLSLANCAHRFANEHNSVSERAINHHLVSVKLDKFFLPGSMISSHQQRR